MTLNFCVPIQSDPLYFTSVPIVAHNTLDTCSGSSGDQSEKYSFCCPDAVDKVQQWLQEIMSILHSVHF